MSKPVRMALIGAGNRGRGIFGAYAKQMPHRAQFVAVAEPDEARRNAFSLEHGIPESARFPNAGELFAAQGLDLEAVIVATVEDQRREPVVQAIGKGYHVLVEKPLGRTAAEVVAITDAAKKSDRVFAVCHQMRYMTPYATIKELIDSGRYGEAIAMQLSENLSYHHHAHSFVRGFFNSSRLTPMILAKCCHDMDIMCYLTGRRPVRVSSFGSLTWFKPENAPKGAPDYCLQGCPAAAKCPYNVLKLYFNDDTDQAYIRQMGVVKRKDDLMELLKTNRFGRCVYRCGNDVVDHQAVNVEFEGGLTVSFNMAGHNAVERRITKISLTNGEIGYDTSGDTVTAFTFEPSREERIKPAGTVGTHGGGDRLIMEGFVDAIRSKGVTPMLTSVEMSLDSHLLAFAAEQSRLAKGAVIELRAFEETVRSSTK
ncbi:MAG: Gfo/Idh/MocA family oxidoreductase [bacterium]